MIKFGRLLFNGLFGMVIPILCFLVFWFGVCLFSASIALISKSTPSELEHMLHLTFDILKFMFISLIVSGGLFLVQYYLTRIIMNKVLKMNCINKC